MFFFFLLQSILGPPGVLKTPVPHHLHWNIHLCSLVLLVSPTHLIYWTCLPTTQHLVWGWSDTMSLCLSLYCLETRGRDVFRQRVGDFPTGPFVCCWETRGLPWSRGSLCSWQNTTKSGDEQRKSAVSSHPRTLAPHQPLIHKRVCRGLESVVGCILSTQQNWWWKKVNYTRT